MLKKQIVLTLTLVSVLTLGLTHSVFAQGGDSGSTSSGGSGSGKTVDSRKTLDDSTEPEDSPETETENESEDATDDHQNRQEDRMQQQEDRIAARKADLTKKFETMKTERKEKLDGKRLEVCQKRQDNINTFLDKSAENSKKKLAVFQRISAGVKAFYIKKNLASDQYAAAVAIADEKEAAAIAAVDAMAAQDFSCDSIDGAKPNGVIREAAAARHEALSAYRTAVKDLIKVVKQAFEASSAASTNEGGQQ